MLPSALLLLLLLKIASAKIAINAFLVGRCRQIAILCLITREPTLLKIWWIEISSE